MDGSITGDVDLDEAADLFLSAFKDAPEKEPSDETAENDATKKKKVAPDTENDTDTETDESDADDENPSDEDEESTDDEDDDKPKRKFAEDDDTTYVKIKVGDDEHEVAVKDLKRLWGQESALTQRSQEVATAKTRAETEATKAAAAITTLLDKAREAAKPYVEMQAPGYWALLAKDPTVTAEQIAFLQKEAQAAMDNVKFLEGGLDQLVQEKTKADHETLVKQARDTVKALTDPETGIKGWNDKLYTDLRNYAIGQGMSADVVNRIVDEKAIRLMHKAYLYDEGQKATTTRVKKVGKRIVKTTSTPKTDSAIRKTEAAKAMDKLRKNGSLDNAADAFLASMGVDDE